MSRLVVDRSLVGPAPQHPSLVVVGRRRQRRGFGSVSAAVAVEAVAGCAAADVLLARPPQVDPGLGALREVAALHGLVVLTLPAHADRARWAVALAARWAREGRSPLVRLVEAVVGMADGHGSVPRRHGGDPPLPAARPQLLARWAGCVWSPCTRCTGGGLASAPCPRCGAPREQA